MSADPWQEIVSHFEDVIARCKTHAAGLATAGKPLAGIMCEFTPREILMAAGATPVCLCGGSASTIPAAEQQLPANLCPLIKSTFGYHVLRSNPFLEQADLVVAETTCDGKKKMFELLGRAKPMYVLELPQKADDPDSFERWVLELRKFARFLEQRYSVEITKEKLWAAIRLLNRERKLRRQLSETMISETPPLTGTQLLQCRSIISGIESDLRQYENALAAERPNHAPGTGQRRVRVLLTGVPVVFGAERVVELIEQSGATVVCLENCTGVKPILEDVEETENDPIRALARKYYHLPCSVMTPNDRRITTLAKLAETYRPECVIDLVWHACLTYDLESIRVREWAERSCGLPFLKITTDYSPADSGRIRARLEALFELVRDRRNAGSLKKSDAVQVV